MPGSLPTLKSTPLVENTAMPSPFNTKKFNSEVDKFVRSYSWKIYFHLREESSDERKNVDERKSVDGRKNVDERKNVNERNIDMVKHKEETFFLCLSCQDIDDDELDNLNEDQ